MPLRTLTRFFEMTRQLSLANSSSDAPVMDKILGKKREKILYFQ
jgi:hypothetical protein